MYVIYKLLRGTIAFNIFIGAVLLYAAWFLVSYLDMELLSTLLGKFVGYGMLILIIIFTPELRKFLLLLGDTTLRGRLRFLEQFFGDEREVLQTESDSISQVISEAITHLSKTQTGALLVLTHDDIEEYTKTGSKLDAVISVPLLESIFFKNSPLHDGAAFMKLNRIIAASCILPVSKNKSIPQELGLRHRAAMGISEVTKTTSIIVSEETGEISVAKRGQLKRKLSQIELEKEISEYFNSI